MNEENNQVTPVENNQPEVNNVDSATQKPEGKVFTEDEVNAIITKRLAKERQKQEKAIAEAERLAKMTSEERAKEELRLEREAFEKERKAHLDEMNAFNKEKMLTQTEKELINNSLPTEFARYLVSEDADQTFSNIKEFKALWDTALQNSINNTLKASSKEPKRTSEKKEVITWEQVTNDPSLFNEYMKQNNK